MILVSIKIENFLSYKKAELNFLPEEQLLIDGKSGAGKSSIIEAVVWCFYGRGRSDNRNLVRKKTLKAVVTIELKEDNKYYRIMRSVTRRNGKQSILVEEKDPGMEYTPIKVEGNRMIQEFIEKILLRSSYTLFVNSVVYPQDNVDSFVKQSASKRKDLILEMINSSSFDEYKDKCHDLLKQLTLDHARVTTSLKIKEKYIDENREKINLLPELRATEANISRQLKELEEKMTGNENARRENDKTVIELEHKKKENNDARLRLTECEYRLNSSTKEYEKLYNIEEDDKTIMNRLAVLSAKRSKLADLEQQEKKYSDWQVKMNNLYKQRPVNSDFQGRIKSLNRLIISKMEQKINLCPELNKPCPIFTKSRDREVEIYSEELKQIYVQQNDYNKQNNEYNEKIDKLGPPPEYNKKETENLRTEIRELESIEKKYNKSIVERDTNSTNLQNKISELLAEKENILAKIKIFSEEIPKLEESINTKKLYNEFSDLRFKITEITGIKEYNLRQITLVEDAISIVENSKKEIEEDKKILSELNNKIDGLELLKEAFGNNGLKAIVIDYVIPRLEDRINSILGQLSTFRIKLDTQKNSVSNDGVIEGLFITIFNDRGEELNFENYSGGEKLKIVVAISEALAEIQKAKFRFLDELFIGLDEESTEKFAEVMVTLQKRFSQLICISHLRNIKDLFEKQILIIKRDGISGIK